MSEQQPEKQSHFNIERKDIGNCRGCEASSEKEEFRGIPGEVCTHLKSQNGWWLRIDHSYDVFEGTRKPDRVGELLCPTCLEEHNKQLEELLNW